MKGGERGKLGKKKGEQRQRQVERVKKMRGEKENDERSRIQ